jgi:hypothetical protein
VVTQHSHIQLTVAMEERGFRKISIDVCTLKKKPVTYACEILTFRRLASTRRKGEVMI